MKNAELAVVLFTLMAGGGCIGGGDTERGNGALAWSWTCAAPEVFSAEVDWNAGQYGNYQVGITQYCKPIGASPDDLTDWGATNTYELRPTSGCEAGLTLLQSRHQDFVHVFPYLASAPGDGYGPNPELALDLSRVTLATDGVYAANTRIAYWEQVGAVPCRP